MKSLMDEYLAHGGNRPLRQWIKQNERLGKIINDAKANKSFDRGLLQDLGQKYEAVNSAYEKIVEVGRITDYPENMKLMKETLSGMVSVRLEELLNSAERLHTSSRSLMQQKQSIAEASVLIAFLAMIGIILLNLLLIRKAIVSPIQELSRGAEIIGSSNFDYSIAIDSKDEIGKLAQTFNAMVEHLRESYDSLQAEIQERKRAEESVKAERQRLYDMLETMPVMICLLSPDYEVVFANRSFREKFPEEHGRKCYEYRFNREKPCDFCEAHDVMQTGESQQWESIAPDGSIIEGYKFPFTDIDGSPLILEMGIDVTERKEAERLREKALETAEILNKIFSTTHFSLVYLDKEFNFIQVNKAYADSCGKPPEYFVGKNHFDLYPHEENEFIFTQVVETGEAYTVYAKPFEFPDDPARGVTYWDWSLYPLKDSYGQVEGLVFILLDVTERHRAEEALQAASAYNRSLIEASLDPLVTISPGGVITDVNTTTEKVTGFSREELIGTSFSDYFTDPQKAREGYRIVYRNGSVSDYELEIQHRNGDVIPVMYNASLYQDIYGNVAGVFAAARNISARKKAEEELLRSNRDLEQFAYVASHDLQEPLRNIAGCMQLLEKKYKNRLDADADQYIHYAVESAVRMKTLILDLLTYSRVGTRAKPPTSMDCSNVLIEALDNLKGSISDTGAVVTHDSLPILSGDETQLLQVFQNLIGNAIKFRKVDIRALLNASLVIITSIGLSSTRRISTGCTCMPLTIISANPFLVW